MNVSEAESKAKELYGPNAFVKESKNGLLDILFTDDRHPNLPYLLGWGHTWEETFAFAEIRVQWHDLSKLQKTKQLDLFKEKL